MDLAYNNNLEYPHFEKKIVIAGKFIFHNLCFNGNISHLFSHFLKFGGLELLDLLESFANVV